MSEHTSGPWRAEGTSVWAEATPNVSRQVAKTTPPAIGSHDSNARFIAAAPDMFEALEKVVSLPEWCECPTCSDALASAQRAVAKAKGETE